MREGGGKYYMYIYLMFFKIEGGSECLYLLIQALAI